MTTAQLTPDTLSEMLRLRGIDAPPDLLAELLPAAVDLRAMADRLQRDLADLIDSAQGDRA